MPFKICVVGCGNVSNTQHGPAITRYVNLHENTLFAACCDIDIDRARDYGHKFDLPNFYTDIDDMLDKENPDAVSLISPVEKTAELSCLIMKRGYPLMLEKPPGSNSIETKSMIDAARENNVPNQVAFNRRYMPLVQKLMDTLKSIDALNEITDIHYRMIRVNRRDDSFSTTAIHGIDLVRYISGADYRHVEIKYHELPQYGDCVANMHLNGVMSSGAIVHLDFLPMSGVVTERLEVNTHKGIFWLELPVWAESYDMPGKITYLQNGNVIFTINGEELSNCADEYILNGIYNENKFFFDSIRDGKKPDGDIMSGLQAVEIADCLNRRNASYSGSCS